MTKSQNRPQRERLPCFKAGISVVKKVKLTVVTQAGERFVFPESKGGERASIFCESDSNDYVVLVALPIDSKNFCENRCHLWPFYV